MARACRIASQDFYFRVLQSFSGKAFISARHYSFVSEDFQYHYLVLYNDKMVFISLN